MPPSSAATVACLICAGVSKLGMPTSRWMRSAPPAISLAAFSYMPKLLGEEELMRVAGHFMAPPLAQPAPKGYRHAALAGAAKGGDQRRPAAKQRTARRQAGARRCRFAGMPRSGGVVAPGAVRRRPRGTRLYGAGIVARTTRPPTVPRIVATASVSRSF